MAPWKPPTPCTTPGCPELCHTAKCERHTREHYQAQNSKDEGKLRRTKYSSKRWRLLRSLVLREEPLCRICKQHGTLQPANVVDHIIPIAQGGTDVRSNLQSLCEPCHNRKTMRELNMRRNADGKRG